MEDGVVGGVGGDRHGLGQVDPGPEHRGEDPADALEDGGLDQSAQDGKLQDDPVEDGLALQASAA